MKRLPNTYLLVLLIALTGLGACNDFLDAKPDQKLVIPTQVRELQGLLDYYNRVNEFGNYAGELSSDNYYIDDLQSSNETDLRLHRWEKDHFFRSGVNIWSY